jgi:hypothetical protein
VLLRHYDDNRFLCVDFNALDFSRHEPLNTKKTKQSYKSEHDTYKEALENDHCQLIQDC